MKSAHRISSHPPTSKIHTVTHQYLQEGNGGKDYFGKCKYARDRKKGDEDEKRERRTLICTWMLTTHVILYLVNANKNLEKFASRDVSQ